MPIKEISAAFNCYKASFVESCGLGRHRILTRICTIHNLLADFAHEHCLKKRANCGAKLNLEFIPIE